MYKYIHVLNVPVNKFLWVPMKILKHENFVKLEITVHACIVA